MSRKILFGIAAMLIVAIVAGLSVSGVALASSQPVKQMGSYSFLPEHSVSGTVLRVSKDEFAIRTRSGQELVFSYGPDTHFADQQHKDLQGAQLKVGENVTVYAARPDRGDMDAFSPSMNYHSGVSGRQFDRLGRFAGRYSQSDADDATVVLVVIGQQASAAQQPAKPAAPAAAAAPTQAPATPAVTPTPKP